MGVAALVLGIVGIVFAWIPGINFIGIICGIVGLILGIIALVQAKKNPEAKKGMPLTGVILSGVAILISIIMTIVAAIALNAVAQGWNDAVKSYESETGESFEDAIDQLQDALKSAGIAE